MMEANCAVLDIKIITTLERDDDIDEPVLKPAGFDTYVAMLKQVETLQCEAKELQEEEAKTLADSVEKALLADDDCDNDDDDDDDDNSEDAGRPPLMTLGKVKKAQEKVQELSEEADRYLKLQT
ncbi:uncharacterized protein [Ptychodera flava]|uniref:uncharacterized protein n=1 Tax=Ptychodera flava TaxID=63121 RepID=UPI003969D008